tara:strand:+ start:624 stop:845 length:222 start_codon:yes stop_codon:yes gene_type:complete
MIHYENDSNIDVIDLCKLYKLNFNKGNVLKYVCRSGKKRYDGLNPIQSEIKDLKKAIDYLEREINFLNNDNIT